MEGKCVFKSSKYLKFPYCTSIQKATILLLKHIHMDCVCMCVCVCTRTYVHVCLGMYICALFCTIS